jgi:hypothetical protein
VRESVARAAVLLDDELCGPGLLQRGDQLLVPRVGRRGKYLERELAAQHRRMREDAPARFRQARQANCEHVLHALGHADLVGRQRGAPASAALEQPTGLDQVTHHLFDEERVPFGLLVDGADHACSRLVTGVRGDQIRHLALIQAAERGAPEEDVTPQIGDQLGERVRGPYVGRAIRADDEKRRFVRRPHHMSEQVERAPVGPMQIVEDEQHGGLRRGVGKQKADGLEQHVAARLRVAGRDPRLGRPRIRELGDEARELVAARAEREM